MRIAAIRLGLAGIVTIVAFAAWTLWVRDAGESGIRQPIVRLYTAGQDAIVGVVINSGQGIARFQRTDGEWRFSDKEGLVVNPDRWGGIVLLLSGPQVDRELGRVADLAEFGLDSPITIVVDLDDGHSIHTALGDRSPDERHYYATLDDNADLFLVNADWGEVLLALVANPPFPYWYYQVDPSRVRVFEIDGRHGRTSLFLGTQPDQPASGRVLIDGTPRDLNQEELDMALSLVGGPRAIQVIPPGSIAESGLGFATPTVTLRLWYELARPTDERSDFSTIYVVGQGTPDGSGYYATTSDTPNLLVFDAGWIDEVLEMSGTLR